MALRNSSRAPSSRFSIPAAPWCAVHPSRRVFPQDWLASSSLPCPQARCITQRPLSLAFIVRRMPCLCDGVVHCDWVINTLLTGSSCHASGGILHYAVIGPRVCARRILSTSAGVCRGLPRLIPIQAGLARLTRSSQLHRTVGRYLTMQHRPVSGATQRRERRLRLIKRWSAVLVPVVLVHPSRQIVIPWRE